MRNELIVKLTGPEPEYATIGSAGADLRASEDRVIEAGEVALIPTGIRLEIPSGYEGQVRPRSGLALKHKLIIPNAPGTIDADYRGEVKVMLLNLGSEAFRVEAGDRIGQLVIAPVMRAKFDVVGELSATVRGAGGFGSTGTK